MNQVKWTTLFSVVRSAGGPGGVRCFGTHEFQK